MTVRWLGFHRIWQGSGEVFDSIDLFLPDVQFGTQVGLALLVMNDDENIYIASNNNINSNNSNSNNSDNSNNNNDNNSNHYDCNNKNAFQLMMS